jgi:ribosome-associated protein
MSATERAIELTRAAATAAADKLATDIIAFDVSEQLAITDVFLVCTASSAPQVRAVQDAVEEALLAMDAKTVRREGQSEAQWVLLDFADIVVHVQQTDMRAYYALERLWSDCPLVPLT